jgi:putative ABC transport system permease protein
MADNQLIAGRWWTPAEYGKPLVSISTEYQEALNLKLGDQLTFDIAGESLTATVASIRKVRWDSFRPNFFMVFPPGLLDGAAGTYMTSVYLTPAQRPALVDLVRRFPTVSVLDVSTRDDRRYESAMLRTLGASRRTVLNGVAAEFSALGFLSGTLAAVGATAIGWVLAVRLFALQYTLDPWVWVVGLVCGTLLVGISGTLATRRVVNTPPIVTLREE